MRGRQGRAAILRDRDRRDGRLVSGRLGDRPLLRQPPRPGDLHLDGRCWAACRLSTIRRCNRSVVGTMLLLVVIGFCIYRPQVLLVGTAPADLAHRGTSAAAAGFVNFMGYMGAATGDVVTGYYSAPEHGGWQWRSTSGPAGPLPGRRSWRYFGIRRRRKSACCPAIVPKLGAIGDALALAGAALAMAGSRSRCKSLTIAAAGCLLGTLVTPLGGRAGAWSSRRPACSMCLLLVCARHERRYVGN